MHKRYLIIAIAFLIGCKGAHQEVHSILVVDKSELINVFHDRHDGRYEWVFIFHSNEIVAQRHRFPGYFNPVIFTLDALPDPLLNQIRQLASKPGDASPRVPPPGTWYARADLAIIPNADANTEIFANENAEFANLVSDLRSETLRNGRIVAELPQ